MNRLTYSLVSVSLVSVPESLTRFAELIVFDDEQFSVTLSHDRETLLISVEQDKDRTEGATLLSFAEKYRDDVIDAAIGAGIDRVRFRCGSLLYPAFNPRRLKELSDQYDKLVRNKN